MPTLEAERKTKRVVLPSSQENDEAWVELCVGVLVGDIIQVTSFEKNSGQATLEVLAKLIKDWNFTDKEGNKAPINVENIKLLSVADMSALTQEIDAFKVASVGLNNAKKKP